MMIGFNQSEPFDLQNKASWHPLLSRQWKRHLGETTVLPAPWQALLGAINEAYGQSDAERIALERSLELCSIELQQEHSEMRAVYERLIFSSVDGIFAFDCDCCFTVWNPTMERIMGVSRLQTLGKCAFDVFPQFQENGEAQYFREAIAGKTVFIADRLFILHQSEEHAYFEMHYAPLLNEAQTIIGGLAVMRDITQRKLAEDAQHRQHEYLLALQEMALSLNNRLELAALLRNVIERASIFLATEHVFLLLAAPDGSALINQAGSGMFEHWTENRFDSIDGIAGRIMKTKQGLVLDDYDGAPGLMERQVQRWAGIPLINGNEAIGVLGAVRLRGAPAFQESEIALLKQLAQLASIAINQDALNHANERLASMAITDPLTGLPNHGCVMDQLNKALIDCQQNGTTCVMLFLDIDHFKHINDTWGHRAGDAVLRDVAQKLTSCIRHTDVVGRYGGEEFAVLLTHIDEAEAYKIAEQLRIALSADPCRWLSEDGILVEIQITASIGVATYPTHGATREALIEAADSAMYRAKHSGRNRVCRVEAKSESFAASQETKSAA